MIIKNMKRIEKFFLRNVKKLIACQLLVASVLSAGCATTALHGKYAWPRSDVYNNLYTAVDIRLKNKHELDVWEELGRQLELQIILEKISKLPIWYKSTLPNFNLDYEN